LWNVEEKHMTDSYLQVKHHNQFCSDGNHITFMVEGDIASLENVSYSRWKQLICMVTQCCIIDKVHEIMHPQSEHP